MRVIAALALMATGCSFVFTGSPPVNHRQLPYFECNSSRVTPALDTVLAAILAISAVGNGAQSDLEFDNRFDDTDGDGRGDPPFTRKTAVTIDVALLALAGASAYYGFTKTSECRAAKTELAIRANGGLGGPQQPGPGTWPPVQPGPQPGPYPAPAPAPAPVPEPAPAPVPEPTPGPSPYPN
jgi:hypothetical protein